MGDAVLRESALYTRQLRDASGIGIHREYPTCLHPSPPPFPGSIDRELRRLRERSALIALTEADALAAVSTSISDALRLAWLASELRADLLREMFSDAA
jgi:hypothetical protein